ncbi:MAG: YopX family protein [Prevotella sp.]|nr:YopX family protein [Lachnospiraceae bacterium]MCM1379535.1 YopX family protein [Bacteroides sp.]MCM1445862.1 YopX family protein [Prevotella sp.]
MREIKFRGLKHYPTGNVWLYGHLWQNDSGETFIKTPSGSYEVDPDTVGQYTCLHDRNGKGVFEGDIVFWIASDIRGRGKGMQGAIIWDAPTMSWAILNDKPTSDGRPMIISRPFDKKHLEIVGNIFDNPELMERANGNKRTN